MENHNAAVAAEHAQTLAAENAWEWEAAEPDPDSDYQDELADGRVHLETLRRALLDAQHAITALVARIEVLERDTASLDTALSEHQHDRDNVAVWPV